MFTYISSVSLACLAALVVPSLTVSPVATRGYAADRATKQDTSTTRLMSATGRIPFEAEAPAVIRASEVLITVPARVGAPRVLVCGPMVALIQGSGSASTCEWRTVGGAR